MLLHVVEQVQQGGGLGEQAADGEGDDLIAHLAAVGGGQPVVDALVGVQAQVDGAVHPGGQGLQLLAGLGQDLHHVGPRLHIGVGPLDGLLEGGVGPGDDEHVRVLPGGHGGLDLAHHLLGADHLGGLDEGAVGGLLLVLDEQAGHPGLLVLPHRADDVHGAAVAALGVGQQGDVHRVHHLAEHGDGLVQRQLAGVRLPQHHAVHAVAGGPGHGEARRLDGAGAERVVGAGGDQVVVAGQQLPDLLVLLAHVGYSLSSFDGSIIAEDPPGVQYQIFWQRVDMIGVFYGRRGRTAVFGA